MLKEKSILLVEKRQKEILDACEKLYETRSFKEITLKDIGAITSFTRTSIYNYFQTKEEIFLALFEREYEYWTEDIKNIIDKNKSLNKEQIAKELAKTLEKRRLLLKILAGNVYDMEENTRIERLASFKRVYGNSVEEIRNFLKKFCKEMTNFDIYDFIYQFFPFMHGIYMYSFSSQKQIEAMDKVGLKPISHSIYELSYSCIKKLLK